MSESNHEQDDRAKARGRPTKTVLGEEPPVDYSHKPPESKRVQSHSSANAATNDYFANTFKTGNWADHTSTPSGTKRLALVISISYGIRKPPPKLTGTYTDAYNIINLLTNQFGYLENEICVLADLIDKSGEKDELRWPSRTNIFSSQMHLTETRLDLRFER
ncbi:hypothetical protein FRC12_019422 [Ceratobasidium sp. 428]|nr:hypothetical protein FRC12_019422 [Ceratobasidium sp. 428]